MPEQLLVPIKRLDETLEVPRYAYEGDAGVDLRAAEEAMQASLCRGAGLL